MTTKELIEHYEEELKIAEVNDQYFKDFYRNNNKPYQFYESEKTTRIKLLLETLSATIPRETAKCKPTEADADKNGYVLSFLIAPLSGSTIWAVAHYKSVANDPKFNRFWLPMPAVPEVAT